MSLRDVLAATAETDFSVPKQFDAIVIGSGAAGGVASWMLCDAGLRVLTLEAGWDASSPRSPLHSPISRLVTAATRTELLLALPPPIVQLGRKALKLAGQVRQPVQSKLYAWELAPGALVDDRACPYETEPGTEFHWFRSRQIGGRMTVPGHGRQYYRFGPDDLAGNGDPQALWPVTQGDLAPWYEAVERALRLRGGNDHAPDVPDSVLSVINRPEAAEDAVLKALAERRPELKPILGRYAPPADWMELAAATGRLSCRTGAVVKRLVIDGDGQVAGAEWFDQAAGKTVSAEAPMVFLCASAFESTRILMLSRQASPRARAGLHSGALGHFITDHAKTLGYGYVSGGAPVPAETHEHGRCIYVQMDANPQRSDPERARSPLGLQIHCNAFGPGRTRIDIVSFTSMQPRHENFIALDPRRTDTFGIPILRVRCEYNDAEREAGRRQMEVVKSVAEALQLPLANASRRLAAPGTGCHESGTARMGSDPDSSVVDPYNECWDVKGLFVTDGAAFPSMPVQNPTLTIMALTARAVDYATRKQARDPLAVASGRPLGGGAPDIQEIRA